MDLHLNCHGELNAVIAAIPFAAMGLTWLRNRWLAWRAAK